MDVGKEKKRKKIEETRRVSGKRLVFIFFRNTVKQIRSTTACCLEIRLKRNMAVEDAATYPNPRLFFVSLSRTTKADFTGPISENIVSSPSLSKVNGRFRT